MRILIVGGSGRTGRLVVDEALNRGNTVTALVRDPASIAATEGLTVVQGSPLEPSDLDNAFGATPNDVPAAVVVTLNARRATDNPFAKPIAPPRLMADSSANTVEAMKKRGIRKIVTLQAQGVGESFPSLFFAMRWVVKHSNMSASYDDHNAVDLEMKTSGLDFVLVRPNRLIEEKPCRYISLGMQGMGSEVSPRSLGRALQDSWWMLRRRRSGMG